MAHMVIIHDLQLYLNERVRNNKSSYCSYWFVSSTPNEIIYASYMCLLSIRPCLIGGEDNGRVDIRIRVDVGSTRRRVCTTVQESIDFMEDVFLTHMDFCGQYLLPMEQEVPLPAP